MTTSTGWRRCARAGDLNVARLDLAVGAPVRVRVRARDVILALDRPTGLSALNVIPARTVSLDAIPGPLVAVRLDCGGDSLVAHLTRKSVEELRLGPGQPVYAAIKSVAFDASTLAGVPPGI